jgi:hypothetical protein
MVSMKPCPATQFSSTPVRCRSARKKSRLGQHSRDKDEGRGRRVHQHQEGRDGVPDNPRRQWEISLRAACLAGPAMMSTSSQQNSHQAPGQPHALWKPAVWEGRMASNLASRVMSPWKHSSEGAQNRTLTPAIGRAGAAHGAHALDETPHNGEKQIQAQDPPNYPPNHFTSSLSGGCLYLCGGSPLLTMNPRGIPRGVSRLAAMSTGQPRPAVRHAPARRHTNDRRSGGAEVVCA